MNKATTTEVRAYLEREHAKGKRGWLDRNAEGTGTHPVIYALYQEYVATGKYPYLDAVQVFITEQLPGFPPFDTSTSGHTQGDPVQRQLQSEIYVASGFYRAEQEAERAATYRAEGFEALADATVKPGRVYLLRRGEREPVKVRPVFKDGELWGFLPPRKRTRGWPLYDLVGYGGITPAYIKPATEGG